MVYNFNTITEVVHQSKRIRGVYLLISLRTNNVYVGHSIELYGRLKNHESYFKRGKHHVKTFQKEFDEFGLGNFIIKFKELPNYSVKKLKQFEGKCIRLFKDCINHDKEPEIGRTNRGKKLSKEWVKNLHKNSNYRHDKKRLTIVTENNKKGGCKLNLEKDEESLNFTSWTEAGEYFKVSSSAIQNAFKRSGKYKGYNITKKSSQRKKVKLHYKEEIKTFNSAGECDRFLNMWRGATSNFINKEGCIMGYKVEYI